MMLLSRVDADAAPGSVSVARLYQLLCDGNVSVLLMDVRSHDDFTTSHVKTPDCINIPQADCLQPGSVLSTSQLQSLLSSAVKNYHVAELAATSVVLFICTRNQQQWVVI